VAANTTHIDATQITAKSPATASQPTGLPPNSGRRAMSGAVNARRPAAMLKAIR
jgi:hypothetical protein